MKTFNDFASLCKTIADNLHIMVEVKDYSKYGFGQASFMTDVFGGTFVCLHFDMKTCQITNWFGCEDERRINDIGFLSYFIKDEMKKMNNARNIEEINDRINEEN